MATTTAISPPGSTISSKKQRVGIEASAACSVRTAMLQDLLQHMHEQRQGTCTQRRRSTTSYYKLQKEKKLALKSELMRLQVQKALYLNAAAPSRAIALAKQQRENEQLRQAVREQQLLLARAQASVTGYSTPPFTAPLHLNADRSDRIAALASAKTSIFDAAERYLAARSSHLDPTLAYAHSETRTAPDGDQFHARFDIVPLPGVKSVQRVLDAMLTYYFNMEIVWTESSGQLMVREGDFDSGAPGVASQRFVRTMASGLELESNLVLYSALTRRDDCASGVGDTALLCVNYVDSDALYPYRPHTRLREDVTAVLAIRAHQKLSSSDDSASDEVVVSLTRAFYGRLHHSDRIAPTPQDAHEIGFGSAAWCKTMLESVTATAAAAPASPANSDA